MNLSGIADVQTVADQPLWLITAAHGVRLGGLIATNVSQASIVGSMPRQLITMNKRHNTFQLVESSGCLAMHLVDQNQYDLVWRFGLQSGRNTDKFSGITFRKGITGSPLLGDAMAWLDCRVEQSMDIGDRKVFLVEVIDGCLVRNEKPLTSHRLFAQAPEKQRAIMDAQYQEDASLDAEAIRAWRETKS